MAGRTRTKSDARISRSSTQPPQVASTFNPRGASNFNALGHQANANGWLIDGIDKLPTDLRTCVILRDIEELSYQEIVEMLQIPEGTVKTRINRGRIELAKILRRMRIVTV